VACLTDDTLVAALHGRLDEEASARVDEHIAECTNCRAVLVESARAVTQPGKLSTHAPVNSARLAPGALVGRYLIRATLGEGGMGVVYEAHDPGLHRNIALKLLRGDPLIDSTPLQDQQHRLLREARAMAQLSHPNVVSVFDVGTFDDRVFIAMELVNGITLKQWMKVVTRDWREVVDVFLEAGAGLEAAHARGLVHRDFKPDNVLIGADGRIRVTDFGLARAVDGAQRELAEQSSLPPASRLYETITRTGFIGGTPAYMAPEQMHGEAPDPRSDQFSFCVAFYEALVSQRPYPTATLNRWAAGDLDTPIEPVPRVAELPRWLTTALHRGLSTSADRRHPSLSELLAALRIGRDARPPRRVRSLVVAGSSTIALATLAWLGIRTLAPKRVVVNEHLATPSPAPVAAPAMTTPAPVPELPAPSTAAAQPPTPPPRRPTSKHSRARPAHASTTVHAAPSTAAPASTRRLGDRLQDPFAKP
jgi:serine/threonine protein kinase